jgi:hypothetical protein
MKDRGEVEASAMSSPDDLQCVDPEVGELLPFHAAGGLAAADRVVFAAHLRACARCAHEERLMRELARGIASLRARPDPAAALPSGTGPRPRARRIVLAGGLAAVAALLVLVLALSSWTRASRETRLATEVHVLEQRIEQLEAQEMVLARAVAEARRSWPSSPLVGIPIASPPNL